MSKPQIIKFEDAKQIMDCLPYVLIDVREEKEYLTGHAEGARLMPVGSITAESAASIISHKDMPVFVYCKSGMRSYTAANKLYALGYTNVFDMGSLVGWPYGISYERDE